MVVGYVLMRDGASQPAVWAGGAPTALPALPGGTADGNAIAVNNPGQIVGFTSLGSGMLRRATLWDQGAAVDLGALDSAHNSFAHAINDRGVVVGNSESRSGQPMPQRGREQCVAGLRHRHQRPR